MSFNQHATKKEIMIWGTIIMITDIISGIAFIIRDELFVGLFGLISAALIGYFLYKPSN